MSLTGVPLLVLVAVLAVALPVAAVLCWRWRRLRLTRTAALVLCGQVLITSTLLLAVNRQQQFFTSWSDLFGDQDIPSLPSPSHGARALGNGHERRAADPAGQVYAMRIRGPRSHLNLPADVYLPPQYDQPGWAHHRFPVVEFLDGFPGNPQRWLGALRLRDTLDSQIGTGRMPPVVGVLPTQSTNALHDSECINQVHGHQYATYLIDDVRSVIGKRLRVATGRRSWGLIGYSTGGFCANNLALQPGYRFAAAASLSGYFQPYLDRSTGDLFAGSRAARQANDPLYQVTHASRLPALSFFAMCATPDPQPCAEGRSFAAAVHAPVRLRRLVLPTGGHNMVTWRAVTPTALDWLGGKLRAGTGPAAPAPSRTALPAPSRSAAPVPARLPATPTG
ncbi:alpha/beta hydrolase, partial [Actinocatenispora thailandica]